MLVPEAVSWACGWGYTCWLSVDLSRRVLFKYRAQALLVAVYLPTQTDRHCGPGPEAKDYLLPRVFYLERSIENLPSLDGYQARLQLVTHKHPQLLPSAHGRPLEILRMWCLWHLLWVSGLGLLGVRPGHPSILQPLAKGGGVLRPWSQAELGIPPWRHPGSVAG